MRGTIIFIWSVLVLTTGYTLFHITFEVEALEEQLVSLNSEIREEQETTHVLRAEWSYLSSPQRLEALGTTLLPDLARLRPEQVMTVEEIPFRLPEGTPEGEGEPETKPEAPLIGATVKGSGAAPRKKSVSAEAAIASIRARLQKDKGGFE